MHPISINKGILYLSTENALVGNNYIYSYDLYNNKVGSGELLEIKFKNVSSQIERKQDWKSRVLKYEKYKPLSKKARKKYFGKIKRDTSLFKQDTHLAVLESYKKAIEMDSLSYIFSHLIAYGGIDRLEMQDDIKAKNYVYFDLMTEGYSKEDALLQISYFVDEFKTFDTQMYKGKMMVKTPDDLFFNLYKIDGLWYMSLYIKRITKVKPKDDILNNK
jgi:hypothetical protein